MKNTQTLLLSTWIMVSMIVSSRQFEFRFASKNIPAPSKAATGGEDSLYANKLLLCVADGVGSWAEEGINAALYSRKLTGNVDKYFAEDQQKYIENPKSLIIKAAENNKEIGSSTLVIVAMDPITGLARASFVGDSCYIILRPIENGEKLKVFYRSKDQQHSFNFPYQLGTDGDSPEKALSFAHLLEYGDIVIVGSDGLFDNLYDEDFVREVTKLKDNTEGIIVEKLSSMAFDLSLNRNYLSPFARDAKKAKVKFIGGKSDDIAIVVGRVIFSKQPEPETS